MYNILVFSFAFLAWKFQTWTEHASSAETKLKREILRDGRHRAQREAPGRTQ